MSERGTFRSGARASRGGRGDHGSARGGRGGHGEQQERPKRENILDLAKYADKRIIVKFNGGREVHGVLKGYDQLMNLVLDDVEEMLRDDSGNTSSRSLGLLVARGTLLTSIAPVNGSEEIANPFAAAEAEEVLPVGDGA